MLHTVPVCSVCLVANVPVEVPERSTTNWDPCPPNVNEYAAETWRDLSVGTHNVATSHSARSRSCANVRERRQITGVELDRATASLPGELNRPGGGLDDRHTHHRTPRSDGAVAGAQSVRIPASHRPRLSPVNPGSNMMLTADPTLPSPAQLHPRTLSQEQADAPRSD